MGVALAEAPERPTELQPGERVPETGRLDVGRRLAGDLAEEPAERADEPVEVRVAIGVARGPAAKPIDGSGLVGPERHRPAVGLGREDADVRRDKLQAVGAQVEIADDRRSQPPDGVGQSRHQRAPPSSLVSAAPPTRSRRSRTSVRRPAFAR